MNRRLRFYMYAIGVAFWAALLTRVALDPGVLSPVTTIAPLLGLAIAGEELVVRRKERDAEGTISFSAIAHVAAATLLNPAAAAATAALGILVGDGLRRESRRLLVVNSAMFGGSIWIAATLYRELLGDGDPWRLAGLPALVVLISARYAITSSIFAGGMAIGSGTSFPSLALQALVEEIGPAIGEGSLGVLAGFAIGTSPILLPFLVPLFWAVYASKANLERLRQETRRALRAIADVVDARDPSTAAHSERVADYVAQFAEAIGLPEREAERLVATARYHDLGKIAVEVRTLTKPGRLSEGELAQIRKHPGLSAQLLRPFSFAAEMAAFAELHHERWDGRGYYGVAGPAMPVEAHVLVVADSFDAMTSDRAYRPALTSEEAVAELRDKAGSQFHPLVARVFAAVLSGGDPADELTAAELRELRAAFMPIRTGALRVSERTFHPRTTTVAALVASLFAVGLPGAALVLLPVAVVLALGSAGLWFRAEIAVRSRRQRAQAALDAGREVEAVLAAAGFGGWVEPLTSDSEPRAARVGPPAADLAEASSWARRREDRVRVRLASGTTLVLSERTAGGRLALGLDRQPRPHEAGLVDWLLGGLADASERHQAPPTPRRAPARGERRAVLHVELRAFERLRRGAGQLIAERTVEEAERRLREALRPRDAVVRLADDRFGISTVLPDEQSLERLRVRLDEALRGVTVPQRLRRIAPKITAAIGDAVAASPELRAVEESLFPAEPVAPRR